MSREHQPLTGADETSDEEWDFSETRRQQGGKRHPSLKYLAYGAFLIVCCLFSAGVGFYMPLRVSVKDKICSAHTTRWSPVIDDVPIRYHLRQFNGSFMTENIYRKEGCPEVDRAWESLGVDYRAGVISYEDGLKSGLDDSFVQRADKYGGGFLVNVEGMHHLHCLNLLRKSLYFNFDRYKKMGMHAFKNDENILRLHVTHCLDTIRQVLMCNVDTAVLGQVWTNPAHPSAFPDFNTRHVCKNYGAVQEWAKQIQAAPLEEIPDDYLAPPKAGDVKSHMR